MHIVLIDFSHIFRLAAFLVVPMLNEAPSHEEKLGRDEVQLHVFLTLAQTLTKGQIH